jgi:hypothetical protein
LHLLSIITFVTQVLLLIYVVNIFVFNLLQCSFCEQVTNNIVVDIATSFLVFFVTMLEAIYFIYNFFWLVGSKFGVWFLGCYQYRTFFVFFINVTLLTFRICSWKKIKLSQIKVDHLVLCFFKSQSMLIMFGSKTSIQGSVL